MLEFVLQDDHLSVVVLAHMRHLDRVDHGGASRLERRDILGEQRVDIGIEAGKLAHNANPRSLEPIGDEIARVVDPMRCSGGARDIA